MNVFGKQIIFCILALTTLLVSSAEGSSPKLQQGRSLDHCSKSSKGIEVTLFLGEVKKEDKLFEYEVLLSYDTNVVYSPGVTYNNTLAEIWGEQNYTSGGDGIISSSGGTTGIVKAASGSKPLVNFSFLYKDGICTDAAFEIDGLYLGSDYVGPIETELLPEIRLEVKSIVKDREERFVNFGFDRDTLDLDNSRTITLNLEVGEYRFLEWVDFEIESTNPDIYIVSYTHSENVEINDTGLGESLLKLEIDFGAKENTWIELEIDNKKMKNETENDRIDYSQFVIKNVLFNECNCIREISLNDFQAKLTTLPDSIGGIEHDEGRNVRVLSDGFIAVKNIRDIKIFDFLGRIVYEKEILKEGHKLNLENNASSVLYVVYMTESMEKKFNKIIIN